MGKVRVTKKEGKKRENMGSEFSRNRSITEKKIRKGKGIQNKYKDSIILEMSQGWNGQTKRTSN